MAAARRRPDAPGPAGRAHRDALRRLRAPARRPGSRLPLLSPAEARRFLTDVRGRVLERLGSLEVADPAVLFPHAMVEQHEQQHVETMLATHQLRDGEPTCSAPARRCRAGRPVRGTPRGRRAGRRRPLRPRRRRGRRAVVAGQRAARARRRPAGLPDRPGPVTNGEWQRFVAAGGYDEPRWWSARGWEHRSDAGLERPLSWRRRRHPAPLRPRRGGAARRAGAARLLLRGRGLRRLGRRPAADRAGVGEGLRLGPRGRPAAPLALGRQRRGRRRWPTSAARRCARHRSGPTPPAPRPTAWSR